MLMRVRSRAIELSEYKKIKKNYKGSFVITKGSPHKFQFFFMLNANILITVLCGAHDSAIRIVDEHLCSAYDE